MLDLNGVEVEILGFALYNDVNNILRWYKAKSGSTQKQSLENELNNLFRRGKGNF